MSAGLFWEHRQPANSLQVSLGQIRVCSWVSVSGSFLEVPTCPHPGTQIVNWLQGTWVTGTTLAVTTLIREVSCCVDRSHFPGPSTYSVPRDAGVK